MISDSRRRVLRDGKMSIVAEVARLDQLFNADIANDLFEAQLDSIGSKGRGREAKQFLGADLGMQRCHAHRAVMLCLVND